MIICKCDNCGKEHEHYEPDNWLNINGEIQNNLKYRAVVSVSRNLHFCSRNCIERYLFMYPNLDLFEKEIKGFKFAIDKTDLTDREKRELFIKYFENNYNKDKLKPISEELNDLLSCYFPIEKENENENE